MSENPISPSADQPVFYTMVISPTPFLGKDTGTPGYQFPYPYPTANTTPIWLRVWVHHEKIMGLS